MLRKMERQTNRLRQYRILVGCCCDGLTKVISASTPLTLGIGSLATGLLILLISTNDPKASDSYHTTAATLFGAGLSGSFGASPTARTNTRERQTIK